jgi:hypothetical protein
MGFRLPEMEFRLPELEFWRQKWSSGAQKQYPARLFLIWKKLKMNRLNPKASLQPAGHNDGAERFRSLSFLHRTHVFLINAGVIK